MKTKLPNACSIAVEVAIATQKKWIADGIAICKFRHPDSKKYYEFLPEHQIEDTEFSLKQIFIHSPGEGAWLFESSMFDAAILDIARLEFVVIQSSHGVRRWTTFPCDNSQMRIIISYENTSTGQSLPINPLKIVGIHHNVAA